MKTYLYFYGAGCPDCARVSPWVSKLEGDEDYSFEWLEVWDRPENEARKAEYANLFTEEYGRATIVPAFVDVEAQRVLCDPRTSEELETWLLTR